MKKEIGSIFPITTLYAENTEPSHDTSKDTLYYSLCREALYDLALSMICSNKQVLIPAYTCQTVIMPFEEAGWTCHFYNIQRDLRIDLDSLVSHCKTVNPALIVVHPYFGMDLNEKEVQALQQLNKAGHKLVVDLTQCIFSKQYLPFVDYYTGSYRKWYPIPDGGYLYNNKTSETIKQPVSENAPFVTSQSDAMYLRGVYFHSGDQNIKTISIRLSKKADQIAEEKICSHRMSSFSYNLIHHQNESLVQKRRMNNFIYLFNHIHQSKKIAFVCEDLKSVTTAPLYFTIYVDERRTLQRLLIDDSIYAPIIWPVEDEKILITDGVRYIYDHLLAIPIDQRYDESDLERVVKIINNYQS